MSFPDSSDIQILCDCLYSDSSATLQQESNRILIDKIGAENVFLLFVSDDRSEFCCKVIDNKVLPEEIRFDVKGTYFEDVLDNKSSIYVNEMKFSLETHGILDKPVFSSLCIPLFTSKSEEEVFSILCIVNKQWFALDDLHLVQNWAKCLTPLLIRSWSFDKEHKIRKQNEALLKVVKTLLAQMDNVTSLLREIMTEARKLTGAERCSLFLLDKEENNLIAKIFDGSTESGEVPAKDICIPASEGIAGHVVSSGEILNIADAYAHPYFYCKIDKSTGFKTKNILCFPIKDDTGVIGVAELCNKINGSHFTRLDEEIAKTFSVYCAICIMHSLMWKKARDDQSRSRLSNDLIIQSEVSEEEILSLATNANAFTLINDEFKSFDFIPRTLSDVEAAQCSMMKVI